MLRKKRIISISCLLCSFLIINILLLYTMSTVDEPNDVIINNFENPDIKKDISVKTSGFWTDTPVWISQEAHWTNLVSTKQWCSGGGTWDNPYIIENVTIDGGDSDSPIYIWQTTSHFVIKNCTLSGCPLSTPHGGILIRNADNGKLIGNNCSNNNYCGIMITEGSTNITVSGNLIKQNNQGLRIQSSSNITVTGNHIEDNDLIGGYIYGVSDFTFSNNNVTLNGGGISNGGLQLYATNNVTIKNNRIYDNTRHGLYLQNSDYNIVFNNNFTDNVRNGILIGDNSDYNEIYENNASSNDYYGIRIEVGSDRNNITNALVYKNTLSGISVDDSDYNIMSKINFSDNQQDAIFIQNGIYNEIIDCNATNNGFYGFELLGSNYTTISGNFINNSGRNGIRLDPNALNNMITNNNISFNGYTGSYSGIRVSTSSNDNTISNNQIYNNTQDGIRVVSSDYNTISENNIINNDNYGIYLSSADNNTVRWNVVDYNVLIGIQVYQSDGNTITGNIIKNLDGVGIYMDDGDSQSDNNLLYNNYFLNNALHAFDGPSNLGNKWNSNDIGNYWDNYTGPDNNFDSIGDIPYNISLSPLIQDLLPKVAPLVKVTLPVDNSEVGEESPNFILDLDEPLLDKIWYSINGGTNITISEMGKINQTLWNSIWNSISEGAIITIRFYANDTLGNIGYKEIILIKEETATLPEDPGEEDTGDNFLIVMLIISGVLGLIVIGIVYYIKIKPSRES